MMETNEDRLSPQLLGYDVRLDDTVYRSQLWSLEYRESLLLKPDVEWPLSVDSYVWPSYFIPQDRLQVAEWGEEIAPPFVLERAIVVDLEEPRYLALSLWASLRAMLRCYTAQKRDAAPGIVIAVWLEHVRSVPHQQLDGVLYPPVTPSVVADDWVLLGYDVTDQFMHSALAGLALAPEKRQALRGRVSPQLNEYGLFSSRQDALDFEATADQLSPDWKPFCVCGLYRIPDSGRFLDVPPTQTATNTNDQAALQPRLPSL
jgi:hypothetical protein